MLKSFRGWSIALVLALIAAVLVSMPKSQIDQANAANASNWDAGYIISDENFYNGRALTSEQQVQSFLQSKNAGCVSGATCILNYREPTPTMAASAYCDRIDGRANESAASIIHRVGQACNISQMALIVLLEKEQSLITSRNPTSRQFTAATGYACPDTAPCDAGFGGFFTQVYYGARAYQYYKTHPTQYRHIAGQWNTVLYNPKASCGSSQVFIQNNATAGLYNYTPYQPNRAALSNLYGTGDTCSAYGNRNFWRLYTDWFGDPRGSAYQVGEVVQSTVTGDYFIYSAQQGFIRVPDRAHMVSLGLNANVTKLHSDVILAAGIAKTRIETWGLQCGSNRYFASSHRLQPFESSNVQQHYAMTFASLPTDLCNFLPKSTSQVSQVAKDQSGGLWVIEDGKKRPATEASLLHAGLHSKFRVTLPAGFVAQLPTGVSHETGLQSGDVVQSSTSGHYFIYSHEEGFVRVPDRVHLVSMGLNANVRPMAASQITRVGISDTVIDSWGLQCGATPYFVTSHKLYAFGSITIQNSYRMDFVQMPRDLCDLLPVATERVSSIANDQHQGVWVLQHGTRRAVTLDHLKSAGLDSRFRVTMPTAFVRSLSTAAPIASTAAFEVQIPDSGTLVIDVETGDEFVYSADEGLMPIAEEQVYEDLGLPEDRQEFTSGELEDFAIAEQAIDSWLVTCAEQHYFAINGALHPIADALDVDALGLEPMELPADLCALLRFSEWSLSPLMLDDEGRYWQIDDGARRELLDDQLGAEGLIAEDALVVPEAYLEQLPFAFEDASLAPVDSLP